MALKANGLGVTAIAKELGVSRETIYQRLKAEPEANESRASPPRPYWYANALGCQFASNIFAAQLGTWWFLFGE